MRLLILSSEFPPGPGGIGTHAYQLARNLTRLNWDVVVATPQHNVTKDDTRVFNAAQPFRIVSLAHIPAAPLKAFYRWHAVSRVIRDWRPNILLASGDREVYLAAGIARRHALPWVAIEHGRWPPRWEQLLKRYCFNQASTVVSVSHYTRRQLIRMGVKPRIDLVIPNGGDGTRFKVTSPREAHEFRRSLGLNGEPILLTVGSVTDRKGQANVIRALPKVLERVPETQYLMAGLPLRQKELAKLAQQLGVADHVHFLGTVSPQELPALFNCCDVFVMTSRHAGGIFEGFGIAVVEAALCGKPSVVSANSGLAEAIINGLTGFAVPENDRIATADAITDLLLDEKQREQMGRAAREHALACQTWESRVNEYDGLLRELCGAIPDVASVPHV